MGRLLSCIAATAIVILAVNFATVRGIQCYCNQYYNSLCVHQPNISCGDDSACEIFMQDDAEDGHFIYQGCVTGFQVFTCGERLIVNPGSNTPYRYCCKDNLCNSEDAFNELIEMQTSDKPTASVTSSTGGDLSLHHKATISNVNPTGTTQSVTMPTSTPYTAVTTTSTVEQPTQADGLKCICGVTYEGSCVQNNHCINSEQFQSCVIQVYKSTMEIVFQGCDSLVTTYYTCNDGEVSVLSDGQYLYMCCQTDYCNSFDNLMSGYDDLLDLVSTPSSSFSADILQPSSALVSMESPINSIAAIDNGLVAPPPYAIALITILAFILLIFIIIIIVVTMLHFFPRHIVGIAIPTESDGTPTISTESGDFSNDHMHDMINGTTSGSGSGMPLLIQRSIATQVTLEHLIGKGKFGEVWKGNYKGDDIAVKIFHTREEASWFHEVEIYSTCLIRHPNIVRFVAADNKDIGMATQLWLITEYCSYGSLYEVLVVQSLDETTMLKLLHTAASGIAHLHQEITGTEGKPAIAHRDIKSRNILVKADYTCCIADLGLSLRYDKTTDTVEEPPTKRVGTRRYLSPEILDDTINVQNFDCFKRSDMYSFGLVMWETARRGECSGYAEEYQLPYFDLVPSDPSFEDMKKVVVDDVRRPGIPNRWHQSELFHGLSKIIEQCWHHNGEARVTALRVKKNLHNLHSMLSKNKSSSMTKIDDTLPSK